MSHPKGYTQEMIKELLGSSWPKMPEGHETGNQMRRRKGNETVSYTHLTLPTTPYV